MNKYFAPLLIGLVLAVAGIEAQAATPKAAEDAASEVGVSARPVPKVPVLKKKGAAVAKGKKSKVHKNKARSPKVRR